MRGQQLDGIDTSTCGIYCQFKLIRAVQVCLDRLYNDIFVYIFVSIHLKHVCMSLRLCPEQAEPAVGADRPEGEGAREGRADVLHHLRPEDPSFLRGPTSTHHHLQHGGLRQSHHPVLGT